MLEVCYDSSKRDFVGGVLRNNVRPRVLLAILVLAALNSSCNRSISQESPHTESNQSAKYDSKADSIRHVPIPNIDGTDVTEQSVTKRQSKQPSPVAERAEGSGAEPLTPEAATNAPALTGNQVGDNRNARVALAAALKSQRSARALAGNGELDSAYTESLSAWQSLQEYADDEACRALAAKLLKELKVYGERLSAEASNRPTGGVVRKPIRFE